MSKLGIYLESIKALVIYDKIWEETIRPFDSAHPEEWAKDLIKAVEQEQKDRMMGVYDPKIFHQKFVNESKKGGTYLDVLHEQMYAISILDEPKLTSAQKFAIQFTLNNFKTIKHIIVGNRSILLKNEREVVYAPNSSMKAKRYAAHILSNELYRYGWMLRTFAEINKKYKDKFEVKK